VKRTRDGSEVSRTLEALGAASRRDDVNLMHPLIECALAYCTVGEMVSVLKDEWGEFRQPAVF
jgi:methylmalonyl-CoA mutase, N-terminal domain